MGKYARLKTAVRSARHRIEVAVFERVEMTPGDFGFACDLLQRETTTLSRLSQERTKRGTARLIRGNLEGGIHLCGPENTIVPQTPRRNKARAFADVARLFTILL